MSKTIEIDLMAEVIMNALLEYSEEATRLTKTDVRMAAQKCAKSLRSESKAKLGGSGKYASGWTVRKVYENADDVQYEAYNSTQPTLTHLLEYGHVKWLWGYPTGETVKGVSHIRPVSDAIGDELAENVKLHLG